MRFCTFTPTSACAHTHTHKQLFYLADLGVWAAAVSGGGVHPPSTFRKQQCQMRTCTTGTFLPEGALLLLDTPATFEPRVGLQAHATAVSQCSALVQVCCKEFRGEKKTNICHILLMDDLIFSYNAIKIGEWKANLLASIVTTMAHSYSLYIINLF